MPWAGLNSVGCSAATMRPCAATSRSRSPRTTSAKRRREAGTERSVAAQRRTVGTAAATPSSSTLAAAIHTARRRVSPRGCSITLSIEDVPGIIAPGRATAMPGGPRARARENAPFQRSSVRARTHGRR